MGLGMPIPDLSNKPGPGRPGYGPSGSYDFQFEVTDNVTFKAIANSGGTFSISYPDGTTTTTSGSSSITSQGGAGIISINKEEGDTTFCDEFAIVGNKDKVIKVISWGKNPWNKLYVAFAGCTNLTDISTTSLITDTTGNLNFAFQDCTSLTEAICTSWDLSAGALIADMFEGCTNLTKLDFTNLKIKVSSSTSRAFRYVGSTTTDGCEFLFSGLDLSTWTYTGTQNKGWFRYSKIKPTSTFANWSFNPSVSPNGFDYPFESATITGTNSILDISGWSSYNGNSMSQWFQNFNNFNNGNTGAKINLTNLNTTNVNSMYFFGYQSGVTELIGLSTLGANTGNTGTIQMERAFSSMRFLKLSGSSNFANAFTSSIKPSSLKTTFNQLGLYLTSDFSEAPILSNLDASQCVTFQNMFQSCKLSTMPNLDTVTFPTTATSFSGTFSSITATSYSGSHLDLSNVTMKPSTLSSAFSTLKVQKLTLGNNVDLSECTIFNSAFINAGTNAQPLEVILPTNADYSSATSFTTTFQGLDGPSAGNPPLTTCVADTLIRRLFATNLNGALTLNLELTKITEAPSVVQSQLDQLRTAGWSVTDNTTDATLPFAYPSYSFDSEVTQSVTPTTVPTGGVFSSTDSGVTVDASTGVVSWASTYMGLPLIRCTYPDGCYNEVQMSMLVTVDNNYSMEFSGVGEYFNAGTDVLGSSVSDMSLSVWINITSGATNKGIFTFNNVVSANNVGAFALRAVTDSRIQAYFGSSSVSRSYNIPSPGGWKHVAIVKEGATAKCFINGNEITADTSPGTIPSTLDFSGLTSFIGLYWSPSFNFDGNIDEMAVFNRALTPAQVKLIYDANSTNKSIKLSALPGGAPVAWYRMGD